MITTYLPNLKKPSNNSSQYYKDFHNVFYLSQITNLTLLSYMDNFIELNTKSIILDVKKDELIQKKIISTYTVGSQEFVTIDNEEAFKSYDLEDLIPKIIEEKIKERFNELNTHLPMIGLQLVGDGKDIDINLNELLKTTNVKNWYALIKGFLNIWEFIFLFSTVEMVLKQILKNEEIYTETLLEELCKHYPLLNKELSENSYLDEKGNKNLWKLYTQLRHIYSHSHGILTQENKNKLSGKLNNFKDSLKNMDFIHRYTVNEENLFPSNNLRKDKFYLLQDEELNIFRNFVIELMETYDEVYMNNQSQE